MIQFSTIILKFGEKGEKSGWTYIDIPADVAQQLKPGNKKSFKVKGFLDNYPIANVYLLPMGQGDFILALNADIRKGVHKNEGAMLQVQLEIDTSEFVYPADIMDCMADDPEAFSYFNNLPESHRKYYIKWIESAKTEPTRTKRIAQMISACARNMHYGEMIRSLKEKH